MKIYEVVINDSESKEIRCEFLCLLETEQEVAQYDAGEDTGDYNALFSSSSYCDDDIFYYVRKDELPAKNQGEIQVGDAYDFFFVLDVLQVLEVL